MTVYKLYASGTASADAAASTDIQNDGHIIALFMAACVEGANALDEGADWEVSFASTNGISTNDTRSSILGMTLRQEFLTSGGGLQGDNSGIGGIRIPVDAGERLYLHRVVTGTITQSRCTVWLYVEDGSMELPTRRRRQG